MGSKIFLRKYRVSAEEIGAAGGLGDSLLVYQAEEIDSGKKVVVEILRVESLKKEVRDKLEANAIAAKKLNHLNIHPLYDFGVESDHLIYVTEELKGTSLEEWVKTHGPLPLGPVLRIASQVVSALGAAGFQRIVHGAINPSNLILVPGQTAEGEWPLVKVRHFVGVTPKSARTDGPVAAFDNSLQYASPEQLGYGVVDFRSEVYSLGSTMWFLLTGAPPPMAPEGPMAAPQTKTGSAADQISALPEKIRRLLAKMLSVNPSARPRDPLAFYLQLQECLTEVGPRKAISRPLEAPAGSPEGMAEMPERRRAPIKAVALAALFLALTALAVLVLPGYVRQRRSVHPARPIGVPIGVSRTLATAAPARTSGPVVILAPPKSGPQQQSPAPAVHVTLVSFTPMVGMPGGKDFKIATLTFRLEASTAVNVTEASFYVDSDPFNDGPAHKPPITLLVHTGVFLGPPGTKVDPEHPMQRTVWLKSQEHLFPNWSLAYNQTENATFRWTIAGQAVGDLTVRPLHKAWPSPRSTPEVRRAEPARE